VQYLMAFVQPHPKRMAHGAQRIVPLEEYDNNSTRKGAPVNFAGGSNSRLALRRSQSGLKQPTVDCDILDGIQKDISESSISRSPLSFNAESALLEGLQLRQRAIEEGAPYLENELLGGEEPLQTSIERSLSLRNDQHLRFYDNSHGIQMKRPFKRSFLSPSSPSSSLYTKRPLYTSRKQQQENGHSTKNHNNDATMNSPSPSPAEQLLEISLLNSPSYVIADRRSNDDVDEGNEEGAGGSGMHQYLIQDQDGNVRLAHQIYADECPEEEADFGGGWAYPEEDDELLFLSGEEEDGRAPLRPKLEQPSYGESLKASGHV